MSSENIFYAHGEADTTPMTCAVDIIGLELEVAEVTNYYEIDNLIYDEYIEAEDTNWAPIVIEEEAQGDVEIELIFRADHPENIIARLEEISHIAADCYTAENNSCHIHINREYVASLGLNEIDIYRATEAVAPLIYEISGRDRSSWDEWCPSAIDLSEDIINRFKNMDKILPKNTGNYDDRYELCNCTNTHTIEIRGFSNYYNFNVMRIRQYINIAHDLIPAVAVAMKGKSYKKDYGAAIGIINEFIKDNNINFDEYQESKFILAAEYKIKAAFNEYNNILYYLDDATGSSPLYAADKIIQALKANSFLTLDKIPLNTADLEKSILNLRTQAQEHYLKQIYRGDL